ncbi:nickel/cobalt transporter [Azospirillum sp. CT11-132]|uniref:nickel/cobalt transporter n=1 Tax=Azospirillum sp. CT11-132 TaxID=3396317 RepID=UPI0039A77A0B
MRFRFLAALLIGWLAASAPVLASPLAGGRSALPEESALSVGGLPEPLRGVLQSLNAVQTDLNQRMAAQLRDIRDQGSVAAGVWLCLIAFAYGVLHAVGPGHGKLVVTSYFLTRRARLVRGVLLASTAALTQALAAILLVGVPVLLLNLTRADALAGVRYLELGSYLLMTGIGMLLLVHALRGEAGCTHDHSSMPCLHHGRGLVGLRREEAGFTLMSLAVGARPCSGAVLVLLFALANDIVPAGLLAVLAMAVGVALTTSLSSLIGIGAHHWLDR